MGSKDPRVDKYIEKSQDFAKPILNHLRSLVHAAVPGVAEDMKWSMPAFMYKGMLCGMASFREHCAFGFWKHDLVMKGAPRGDAMGSFGRITSLEDLPSDKTVVGYLERAAQLNDEGVKVARKAAGSAKPRPVPLYFAAALRKNAKASDAFRKFSTSKKNEYVEWIAEAKTDSTRDKRMATALAWIAQGKHRNWKHERN